MSWTEDVTDEDRELVLLALLALEQSLADADADPVSTPWTDDLRVQVESLRERLSAGRDDA